jgi:hypothetical protein
MSQVASRGRPGAFAYFPGAALTHGERPNGHPRTDLPL